MFVDQVIFINGKKVVRVVKRAQKEPTRRHISKNRE